MQALKVGGGDIRVVPSKQIFYTNLRKKKNRSARSGGFTLRRCCVTALLSEQDGRWKWAFNRGRYDWIWTSLRLHCADLIMSTYQACEA